MAKHPRRERFVCLYRGCCNFLGRFQSKYCSEHKKAARDEMRRLWNKTQRMNASEAA